MKRLFFGLLCLLFSFNAFAAGFALYEGSARGNVLGDLTAAGDDASVIFFNPAGMTHLEGTQFMGGVTLIQPWTDLDVTNSYTGVTTDAELEVNVFTPPHLYITHQLNEKVWIGGGLYTRFGLGTEYEPEWEGRYSNIETIIETVSFSANAAYKVNENFSLGFGLYMTHFTAELNQAVDTNLFLQNPAYDPETYGWDAKQTLEGEANGYGFNLSALYKTDTWSVGLNYVSSSEYDLEGTARFTRPEFPTPAHWYHDTEMDADTIELPEIISLGFAGVATDKISWNVGYTYTGWSTIQELVFNYDNPFIVIPGVLDLDEASRELHWDDVSRYNAGISYKYSPKLTLLGGLTYDESPVPDETVSYLLPTNDRTLFNLGLMWQRDTWRFDIGYNYLTMKERNISDRQAIEGVPPSKANGGAHLLGISVSRNF